MEQLRDQNLTPPVFILHVCTLFELVTSIRKLTSLFSVLLFIYILLFGTELALVQWDFYM